MGLSKLQRNGILFFALLTFLQVSANCALAQTGSTLDNLQKNACGFRCPQDVGDQIVKDTIFANQPGDTVRNSVAPVCPAVPAALTEKAPDILRSARKIMALIYGSCNAPNLPIRSLLNPSGIPDFNFKNETKRSLTLNQRNEILKAHPYLQDRLQLGCTDKQICDSKEVKTGCSAASCFSLNNPPLYQWGVKAKGTNIFVGNQPGEKNASGIDCSGFIAEAMKATGWRAYPNQSIDENLLGTNHFWELGSTSKKSCFNRVMTDPELKPGDIIVEVGQERHVAMIGSMGNDPFGVDEVVNGQTSDLEAAFLKQAKQKPSASIKVLNEMKVDDVLNGTSSYSSEQSVAVQTDFLNRVAESACDELLPPPEKYKITIIHSAAHDEKNGGSVGIQQEMLIPGVVSENEKKGSQTVLETAMQTKAKFSCIQKMREKWAAASPRLELKDALAKDSLFMAGVKNDERNAMVPHILRHDPTVAGCDTAPAKLDNEACVGCCTYDISYEGLTTKR